jgi:type IV pilus assembly protein PilC
MFFFRRLSIKDLIDLCRSMRYSLSSGLTLRDVMDLLTTNGPPRLRPVAAQISKELKSGWSLQDAIGKQSKVFPPIFLALVTVGEESGNLPEVLTELEKYYRVQQKLRREFMDQITWPVIQMVMAVLVIAGLIWALTFVKSLNPTGGGDSVDDPLGFGLVGTDGALKFLGIVFGGIAGIIFIFWGLKRLLARRAMVEKVLLYTPIVGPCIRAIALTRFCVALHLMLETSLSVRKTLRLALVATDNLAFTAAQGAVESALVRGETITSALTAPGVFPSHFLGTIAVAEESGRLPEVLRNAAEEYDEEARRRLNTVNKLFSYGIWIFIGGFLAFAIFRIFQTVYVQQLEKYNKMTGGGG